MINVIGNIFGTSGYDSHTRGLVNELNKLVKCKLVTSLPPQFERDVNDAELVMIKLEQDYDINLIVTHPVNWKSNLSAKRNWTYLIWEGDCLPKWILEECGNDNIEKIIVASNHTLESVKNTKGFNNYPPNFIDKFVVIPHGHNPEDFHPIKYEGMLGDLQNVTHARVIRPAKEFSIDMRFKFLANKGLRNLEDRGGLQYLIKAYLEEFTGQDNVELILKINPAYGIPNISEMFPDLKTTNKIRFITENYTTKQLNELYNECDVFVSPTRAEAFNLPCLEAMACGKPVITTNYGGQTDFIDNECGWLIDYDLVEVTHELEYEGISWGNIKIEDLKKQMRWCYENKDICSAMEDRCLSMTKCLTWENTAKQIHNLL